MAAAFTHCNALMMSERLNQTELEMDNLRAALGGVWKPMIASKR